MDRFFSVKNCDRCNIDLSGKSRIMSKMNTDVLCSDCHEEEMNHEHYKKACDAEHEEIKKGNYNYEGLFVGQKYPFK